MKWAALDIGSNSVRYLVVSIHDARMIYLTSGTEVTRLTEGIGRGQVRVRKEALDRTVAAVAGHLETLSRLGVDRDRCVFFGTESIRSASNAEEIRRVLEDAAGLPLEVLSGEEEGYYSASGAFLSGLTGESVFDLGGGSLELHDGQRGVSLPLGAVRVRGLFDEDPAAVEKHVRSLLGEASVRAPRSLIGVGGTSSTIAMVAGAVPVLRYHPSVLHGNYLSLDVLCGLMERLRTMDIPARRDVVGMEPKRADIVVSGLCVIVALLRHFGLEGYRHSECDLLWGRLGALAAERGFPVREAHFPSSGMPAGAGQVPFQKL